MNLLNHIPMVPKNTSGNYCKYIFSVNLAGSSNCKSGIKTHIHIVIEKDAENMMIQRSGQENFVCLSTHYREVRPCPLAKSHGCLSHSTFSAEHVLWNINKHNKTMHSEDTLTGSKWYETIQWFFQGLKAFNIIFRIWKKIWEKNILGQVIKPNFKHGAHYWEFTVP